MGSIIFLIRFFFINLLIYNINYLIIFRIFMKLGVAPFHIWFISILKTRSLFILIILRNLSLKFDLIYFIIFLNIIMFMLIISRIINLNKIFFKINIYLYHNLFIFINWSLSFI